MSVFGVNHVWQPWSLQRNGRDTPLEPARPLPSRGADQIDDGLHKQVEGREGFSQRKLVQSPDLLPPGPPTGFRYPQARPDPERFQKAVEHLETLTRNIDRRMRTFLKQSEVQKELRRELLEMVSSFRGDVLQQARLLQEINAEAVSHWRGELQNMVDDFLGSFKEKFRIQLANGHYPTAEAVAQKLSPTRIKISPPPEQASAFQVFLDDISEQFSESHRMLERLLNPAALPDVKDAAIPLTRDRFLSVYNQMQSEVVAVGGSQTARIDVTI